jgi:hypothetical protein
MLNQSFLPAGLEAMYRVNGKEAKGFVVLFEGSDEAKAGLEAFRAFFEESGGEFVSAGLERTQGFGVKSSYSGVVLVALEGRFLVGVEGLASSKEGESLLNHLRKSVSRKEG